MFTGRAIVAWLGGIGIRAGGPVLDVDLVDVAEAGRDLPDMPDRAVFVTVVDAPAEAAEGVIETVGFQVRIRWDQGDPTGAEVAALRADRAVKLAADGCPCWVAGDPAFGGRVRLLWVARAAGRPTPLGNRPSLDGDRTTYVCTYLATVAEHEHGAAHDWSA